MTSANKRAVLRCVSARQHLRAGTTSQRTSGFAMQKHMGSGQRWLSGYGIQWEGYSFFLNHAFPHDAVLV